MEKGARFGLVVKGAPTILKLTVMQRADSPGDWHIGYLDGRPAVGNYHGEWFVLTDDAVVHNRGQRLIWLVKLGDNVWSCIHEMHWQGEPVPPPPIREERPDYIEGARA